MKKTILYSLIYTAVFVNITALIIFLNSKYNNMFEFDFRPKSAVVESDSTFVDKTLPEIKELLKQQILDSLAVEEAKADSLKKANQERQAHNKKENKKQEKYVDLEAKRVEAEARKAKQKEQYEDWKKKTAAMFEQMDAVRAAKIIEKYSDNTARDIIYTMNKKKAAKILAALDPEFANKVTAAK